MVKRDLFSAKLLDLGSTINKRKLQQFVTRWNLKGAESSRRVLGMGRRRPGGHFAVLLLGAGLGACVLGARGDRLAFPKTTDAAILEEDLEFCRTLGAQARPEPPADGWNGPLTGVPKGMLVYGKMDSDGDGPPAAKFFVGMRPCAQHQTQARTHTHTHTHTHTVGTLANVSSAAMIATVEGIDFDERRRWDPSCMLLKPLHTDGEDDVVQWRSVIFVRYPSCTFTYTPGPLAPMNYCSFTCTLGQSAPRKYYSSKLTCTRLPGPTSRGRCPTASSCTGAASCKTAQAAPSP